jgi:hypothetical protein
VTKNIDHVDDRTSMVASSFILPLKQNKTHGNQTHQIVVRRKMQNVQIWIQLGADIDGEAAADRSGRSVSLSSDGTVLAVGAPNNDGTPIGTDRGSVRVYQYTNDTWNQLGGDIDGEASADNSGVSVSLSSDGTMLAVGAHFNDGNGSNCGHIRVYKYANSTWTQLGADIGGEAAGDYSGTSVSLSNDGTVLAAGAPNNDGKGSNSGHVRVYKYANSTWTQLGADIDGEASGDYSGRSVSLSSDGTVLAVGAPNNDGTPIGTDQGSVRVYQYANDTWNQLGGDIDGEAADDNSGVSVSLSSDGTVLAVGAPSNDVTDRGHVRVYQYANHTWTQLGGDIDGEAASDYSGTSVSLSSDGTMLAVGASYNDGKPFYPERGHVRVYHYANSTWTQLGADIDGEAAGDYFGTSVSLSSDGSVVAIGAPNNDGNGSNSGHSRVFSIQVSLSTTE